MDRYAYICLYEDIETYTYRELPLNRAHGQLNAHHQAHETQCISWRSRRNQLAHIEKGGAEAPPFIKSFEVR